MKAPFPSAPSQAAAHVVWFYRDGDMRAIHTFGATYSARHFIDAVLEGYDVKWKSTKHLTAGNIEIKSEELEDILEARLSKDEQAWRLPDPYPDYVHIIRTGQHRHVENRQAHTSEQDEREAPPPKRARAKADAGDAARDTRKRSVPDGAVSLAQICEENKIDPSKARAKLRQANEAKPYAWPKAEVSRILRLIK